MFTPLELEFLFQRANLPISPADKDAARTMHVATECIRKLIELHNAAQVPEGRTVAPAEAGVLASAASKGKKIKLAEAPKAQAAAG